MMTRRFGSGTKTHDDTGLVLNKKPMMTETPQTRKIFFLKKKLDPENFFLEFFFWGGFGKPVSSWVLVESNPCVSYLHLDLPRPHSTSHDSPGSPPACHGAPIPPSIVLPVAPRRFGNRRF